MTCLVRSFHNQISCCKPTHLWLDSYSHTTVKQSKSHKIHCCLPSGMCSGQSLSCESEIHTQWCNLLLGLRRSVLLASLQVLCTLKIYSSPEEGSPLELLQMRTEKNCSSLILKKQQNFIHEYLLRIYLQCLLVKGMGSGVRLSGSKFCHNCFLTL